MIIIHKMKTATEYIKEAWAIYSKKENFIFFARIMAVLSIIAFTFGMVNGYFFPADYLKDGDFSNVPLFVGFILISILSIVFGLWSQTVQSLAVVKMNSDEKEIFKSGIRYSLKYFVTSLIVGFFTVLGLLLFVFAVWYSFAPLLVLDKNYKVRQALGESREMVRGKFWKILGRFVVFGLFLIVISVVVSIVPLVGEFAVSFLSPLFMLPFYLLYRDLSINS